MTKELEYPPYSPDMTHSDNSLVSYLKKDPIVFLMVNYNQIRLFLEECRRILETDKTHEVWMKKQHSIKWQKIEDSNFVLIK